MLLSRYEERIFCLRHVTSLKVTKSSEALYLRLFVCQEYSNASRYRSWRWQYVHLVERWKHNHVDDLKRSSEGKHHCLDHLQSLPSLLMSIQVGGWSWPVFLGRIDGAGSFADEVNGSLPERRDNFTKLVETFAKVGLDAKDMIILSGLLLTCFSDYCFRKALRVYVLVGNILYLLEID